MVKAGVGPKDAKELARHSTITLTMDRYAHVSLEGSAAAVGKLANPTPRVQPGVPTPRNGCGFLTTDEETKGGNGTLDLPPVGRSQVLDLQASDDDCGDMTTG